VIIKCSLFLHSTFNEKTNMVNHKTRRFFFVPFSANKTTRKNITLQTIAQFW